MNDLLVSADSGALTILVLLDLSAAFDTVCHSTLIERLETWLGISGTVLEWFKSYLTDSTQFVVLENNKSNVGQVCHGVPQGSVLGMILFNIYMLPLGQIIRKHGLGFHFYADDTQIYISTKTNIKGISATLSDCQQEIKLWMYHDFLKLNGTKSEALLVGRNFSLHLENNVVSLLPQVRNLGVLFDSHLTLEAHIKSISESAFFLLRNIARIRPFLSLPDAERLVHALVTSRGDYCIALYLGLPAKSIKQLQHIQNSAARVLTHTPSRQHISGVLRNLYWLPVQIFTMFLNANNHVWNHTFVEHYIITLTTSLRKNKILSLSCLCEAYFVLQIASYILVRTINS
uniref:Reverse transcriptase domain-containing protein n=1 Tax=Cyprinus carpio TaxID=7962 RepID=A0A8C2C5A6_CYPCA